MWFRGVAASVGLCFDFGAVLEGHPDVVLSVNGDVVHHRQPVCFPELRQRLPAPQLFQVGFDLVPSGCALGNQVSGLGVSGLDLIESGDQRVVAFLVFRLVEGDMCVFIDAVLNENAAMLISASSSDSSLSRAVVSRLFIRTCSYMAMNCSFWSTTLLAARRNSSFILSSVSVGVPHFWPSNL